MHRLARLVGAMYSVYRSKHALSAGKNREFGGAAVEHQGGRKTVNYRGPNSPRLLWITQGAPAPSFSELDASGGSARVSPVTITPSLRCVIAKRQPIT